MKTLAAFFTAALVPFTGCQKNYYTSEDFKSVLKIDSHVHIGSDKGFFEDQALKDNFKLITINVDHSDSASVVQQLECKMKMVGHKVSH
jgi:hypothetical protein